MTLWVRNYSRQAGTDHLCSTQSGLGWTTQHVCLLPELAPYKGCLGLLNCVICLRPYFELHVALSDGLTYSPAGILQLRASKGIQAEASRCSEGLALEQASFAATAFFWSK